MSAKTIRSTALAIGAVAVIAILGFAPSVLRSPAPVPQGTIAVETAGQTATANQGNETKKGAPSNIITTGVGLEFPGNEDKK